MRVGVAKPVETGCRPVDAAPPQTRTSRRTRRRLPRPRNPRSRSTSSARIASPIRSPRRLPPRARGTAIDFAALVRVPHGARRADTIASSSRARAACWCRSRSPKAISISRRRSGAPVLFVVGSRLGAINHARLSLEVLAAHDVATVGYVVNRLAPTAISPSRRTRRCCARSRPCRASASSRGWATTPRSCCVRSARRPRTRSPRAHGWRRSRARTSTSPRSTAARRALVARAASDRARGVSRASAAGAARRLVDDAQRNPVTLRRRAAALVLGRDRLARRPRRRS